jgi:CspA family cold shock protein
MKLVATVKWFDAKKGYGFLDHPDGGADIFVHYTSVQTEARFRTLTPGETVEFELANGPKGVHARDVISIAPAPDEEAPQDRFHAPRAEDAALAPPAGPHVLAGEAAQQARA